VTRLKLTILCAIFAVGPVQADSDSQLEIGDTPGILRLEGTQDGTQTRKVYIVQLKTPAAAEAFAASVRVPGAGKPAPGTSRPRFDKSSGVVQSQVQKIEAEQSAVLTKAGPDVQQLYSYRYSMNGFAAVMTVEQANKVEHMEEVLRIWEDEVRPLATNYSASFLDLFDENEGLRGPAGLDGEDVIIGVIDSGIAPEHPALQETRPVDRPSRCWSTWADVSLLGRWLCRSYNRADDILDYEPPENWNGVCETGPEFDEEDCNNKMIAARIFVDGAQATGPIDDGEIFSARDVDGHGTHIATTAAGNKVKAEIFGTSFGSVEGMAPRARIATYKACWLRPGATRAACNTSDLANAIDMAVADGVDIINYSIGSSLYTITAPDDFALIGAAKAGVLAVVAAGNEGPFFDTITSPASNPAVITVGASSRDGQHSLRATEVTAPPSVADLYAVKEAAFTPPLRDVGPIEADLVLVDDDDESLPDGSDGTTMDACQPLDNASDVDGKIAFIERGGCDFDVKVRNAEDAGAVAALVFNIAGPPVVMIGDSDSVDIPALMIGGADGNLLLDELDEGRTVSMNLDASTFISVDDTGNEMANFSSRGPGVVQDILKPDVTAPGVNILAGHTPDAVSTIPGELFRFLSGTSMAVPHVAGVAAMLKQGHPDWGPAEIKSALMTTARQDVQMPDELEILPFDYGSGHIVPNASNSPGLVYDITDEEYDAFSCAIGSPDVDDARCDQLEADGYSFEPVALNQPNISLSRLTGETTVTRRVTSVSDTTETYNVEIEFPIGVDVQITPQSLTLGPGQSAEFDVTLSFVDGEQDSYRFGSYSWVSGERRVRSVISIQPLSVDAPGEIYTFDTDGTTSFPVEFGYSGPYTPGVHGLRLPVFIEDEDENGDPIPAFVEQDPNKTFTFRDGDGVRLHQIFVPEGEAYLRFSLFDELTDGNDDLDLYLYYCPDGINCFKAGESGGPTSAEQIDLFMPPGGTYAVLVHGFETDNVAGGPGANYTGLGWSFGLNEDLGNMTALGPGIVTAGTTEEIVINWTGLDPNTIYLGGISHNTPEGLISLTVINVNTIP
jgi:subtilisin family serine protease